MAITRLTLNKKSENQISKGYPLLKESTVVSWKGVQEEGTLIDLYSSQNKFIARAYYGRQNKGFGWVLTRDYDQDIDQAYFTERLTKAFDRRKKYAEDPTTTAYRLFNGEGDGIGGLTIDYLDGHYLVTWYSLGIYQFKDLLLKALTTSVVIKSVYEKKRFDAKGTYLEDDDFVMGIAPEFPLIVLENKVKFAVYLNDGPMIGFFLDQKDVRDKLKTSYSNGKTVLNTFSYTGAFSIYAALGGASKTTSVDLANRSKARTKEHFEINGLLAEKESIIVEDVFNYFNYAVRKALKFDVVILDPPSFARSKKRTFSVFKDYTGLLEQAIALTEVGGTILASTNYSNGDMKWFKSCVQKAFAHTGKSYDIEAVYTLPDDFRVDEGFREGDYLKVLFIRVLG